jgi:hypothetical protein
VEIFSCSQVPLSQLPTQNSTPLNSSQLNWITISSQPLMQSSTELPIFNSQLFITPLRGLRRQHPVSPVACVIVAMGPLPRKMSATTARLTIIA